MGVNIPQRNGSQIVVCFMINAIIDMTDPSHSTVRSLVYNMEHRGRPAGKNEQSRRRTPILESSTSESKGASNSTLDTPVTQTATIPRVRYNQPPAPPILDSFIQELLEVYQDFISYTVDVQADDHCGFRAIVVQVGYCEDDWVQVRMDLIEEIQKNMDLYNVLYPEYNYINTLLHSFVWFQSTVLEAYWMDSMALRVVIASRYNLVLHMFDTYHSGYFIHLLLRFP
ncbi:uncharacterized protein LOC130778487 [Actinidia eriantha]|uniref:uncharacterized protein LOC130778487 n=1 Tax=Actinidia eriantha TaxID=165200 RepID=UPI002588CCFF|nr:uncharacterized protein LOC130778487 [Actinidia eriantha]